MLAASAVVVAAFAASFVSATAASAVSLVDNASGATIAVQGPGHRLDFYWALSGSTRWHPEQVTGAGTTYA